MIQVYENQINEQLNHSILKSHIIIKRNCLLKLSYTNNWNIIHQCYIDDILCVLLYGLRSCRFSKNFKTVLQVVILDRLHIGSTLKSLVPKAVSLSHLPYLWLIYIVLVEKNRSIQCPSRHTYRRQPKHTLNRTQVSRYLNQGKAINKTLEVPKPLILFVSLMIINYTFWV